MRVGLDGLEDRHALGGHLEAMMAKKLLGVRRRTGGCSPNSGSSQELVPSGSDTESEGLDLGLTNNHLLSAASASYRGMIAGIGVDAVPDHGFRHGRRLMRHA